MFCRKCNKVMRRVMSFHDGKAYEFYRCPKCWYESKKLPLIFKDKEVNQKKKETNNNAPKRNRHKGKKK